MKRIILFIPILLFCLNCSTVPLTGRKQLAFIPSSQINSLASQNYQEVLKESKLSNNQQQVEMIRRVGNRIVAAVEKYLTIENQKEIIDGFKWEFNLIESEQVNAWCMPGGKVAFYTGIMPICKDDNGVAVVMSHEIAHAIAQHGNERMSQQLTAQMGGVALQVAMQEQPAQTQQLAMTAFGVGSQVGVLLPFSRTHESEADKMGLYFMTLAGYDPYEAPRFWERMNAGAGGNPPEFLSTHPNPSTRIANMQKWIPEALAYKAKYEGK